MSRDQWTELASYLSVATIAVSAAFLVSLRFAGPTHAQNTTAATPEKAPEHISKESAAEVAAEVQGFLEPFIYDASNRRDPFQPYIDFRPITENNQNLPLSPMQRYDIDDFHLVGILWDVHDPKAMFVDPAKKVHIVGRDESIGKRNGYIAAIREGEVVVMESSTQKGELIFKPKVLRIER